MSALEPFIDHEFLDEEKLPYRLLSSLGHGQSGTVEKVQDGISSKVYARKSIRITGQGYGQAARTRDVFQNEVNIIRGLEGHRHIIRVHATYYTKRYFGILLDPVASDGDLEDYIDEYYAALETKAGPKLAVMTPSLERGFGCLAAGLAFMHGKRIRHKDIKPRNILVHEGRMIYSDFGYSFDSNGFTHSTTGGIAEHFTRRYSSPEVLERQPRNSNSDVFSLGCVFIDMFSALVGHGVPIAMEECFADVIEHVHGKVLSAVVPPRLAALPWLIIRMTQRKSFDRLCSTHAASELLQRPQYRCDECGSTPIKERVARFKHDGCRIIAAGSHDLTSVSEGRPPPTPRISGTVLSLPSSSIIEATPLVPAEPEGEWRRKPLPRSPMTVPLLPSQGSMNDSSGETVNSLSTVIADTEPILPIHYQRELTSNIQAEDDSLEKSEGSVISSRSERREEDESMSSISISGNDYLATVQDRHRSQKSYSGRTDANVLSEHSDSDDSLDDDELPLYELLQTAVTSFQDAIASCKDSDSTRRLFDFSSRLHNWVASIHWLTSQSAPLTDNIVEDRNVEDFLKLVALERPFLSSLLQLYLGDIVHRLEMIKICEAGDSTKEDDDTAVLQQLLESAIKCLCLQLKPIAAFAKAHFA